MPLAMVLVLILGQPATALAYVGPGAGLSIIGSLLSFFAAIIVGIFGFLWFPVRRLLRKRKQARERKAQAKVAAPGAQPEEPAAEDAGQSEGGA